MPPVGDREFSAVARHPASTDSVPGAGCGKEVEVSRVAAMLASAQLGSRPVLIIFQGQIM